MSPTPPNELLIIGAGVSGQTLALALADAFPQTTVRLVDDDEDRDYNISFWTDRPTPYTDIVQGTWRRIAVRQGADTAVSPLARYRLHALWRADFDAWMRERFAARPNVHREHVDVTEAVDAGDHALLETTAGSLRGDWAFDSRVYRARLAEHEEAPMLMQGLAVEVRTERPCFDPSTATLFDFLVDTPQFDFMYLLPYDRHAALVNVAYVTPPDAALPESACREVITDYLHERVGCTDFEMGKACYGRLPLTTRSAPRKRGARVMPIGARAGMIKASSSYAFMRIHRDTERIVDALQHSGQPYARRNRPAYYRWADHSTARVFHSFPKLAQTLMFHMFRPDTGDLALAFLDERNTLAQNRTLIEGVPPQVTKRFLRTLLRESLRRG